MKNILSIIIFSIFFVSCERYEQPKLLSLSGEYVIDKISYNRSENSYYNRDSVFTSGSLYVNKNDKFPIDSIKVGSTRWHLDYSVISFGPVATTSGKVIWTKQYFYQVIGQLYSNDLGYIDFECESSRRVFKILEDGMESLTLKTTGNWPNSSQGSNEFVTIYLTRIGP